VPARNTPPLRTPWLLAVSAGFLALIGLGPMLSAPGGPEAKPDVGAADLTAAPTPKSPPDDGSGPVFVGGKPLGGCTATGPTYRKTGPPRPQVALTFDDGPSVYTHQILDILKRDKAEATFFVLGSQMKDRSDVMRRVLKEGSMLANHSFTHSNLAAGGKEAQSELDRANAGIQAAAGFTPCLFRAPYGATSPRLIHEVRKRGMLTIQWDTDTNDYMMRNAAMIERRAMDAKAGSIVLMHDGGGDRSQTVAALPHIIASLHQRGYVVRRIPGC
jgi:peptidoglycan-N-acetylglucosamine deacetylase